MSPSLDVLQSRVARGKHLQEVDGARRQLGRDHHHECRFCGHLAAGGVAAHLVGAHAPLAEADVLVHAPLAEADVLALPGALVVDVGLRSSLSKNGTIVLCKRPQ